MTIVNVPDPEPYPAHLPLPIDVRMDFVTCLSDEVYKGLLESISDAREMGVSDKRWSEVLLHRTGNTVVTFRNGKFFDFNRGTRAFQRVYSASSFLQHAAA